MVTGNEDSQTVTNGSHTGSTKCNIHLSIALMLFYVLLMCYLHPTQARDRSVSRLNYGAYFKHVDSIFPTTAIWRLTYVIDFPTHQFGAEFDLEQRMSKETE